MAWWKFGGAGGSPIAMIRRLARVKTYVQVHVEGRSLFFRTVIALRGRRVILARPMRLTNEVKTGATLRVYHEDTPEVGVRLHVVHPEFLLSNGNSVIVCELPEELVEACRRVHDRYDTSRFPGLRLAMGEPKQSYPVVDLSLRGCRVRIERGLPADVLPLEHSVRNATLLVGRQRVPLERLVPVGYIDGTVGCYLEPSRRGGASQVLSHLIGMLIQDANLRHRIDPTV